MPFYDKIPEPMLVLVGVFIMLLGISFAYKAGMAMIRGKMVYWEGFLPFTIISPFTIHLPAGKNSLVKTTEALWIHMIMGPIFMITSVLCLAAGADLANLPGTYTLNLILCGGKSGEQVVFNKRTGYRFPIFNKAGPILAKMFNTQAGMKDQDALYHDNGSYADAANK